MGKLGQLLVTRGWITVQQLTRALKNQGVVGARLGTCLLEMDALPEDLLLKGLSEQLGVPAAAVEDLRGIPEEVRDLLPARLARRCRAIPFRVAGGALDIAMADTRNLGCQDEIAFATGKRVRVHIANEIRLFEALEKYYDEECPARFTHLLDRLNRTRYLWEREAAGEAASRPAAPRAPEPPSGSRGPYDPLAPPLRLEAPPLPEPPLPEPPFARPPQPPRPVPVLAAVPPRTPTPPAPPPAPMAPAAPMAAMAPMAPMAPMPPAAQAAPMAQAAQAAPAAPAAPAAAKPAPVRSISLTDDEIQALGRREAEIPSPASLLELQAAFEATHDRDEVGQILLAFLARSYKRTALFQVGRDRVSGWRGRGEGVDGEALARFSTGFDQPSIFLNLRQGNGLYLGPLPPMPVHRELARSWGGELARECVMLPVRLRDRLVTVIYAEGPGLGAGGGLHLEELKRLTDLTAAAFERCILHKKQAGTGA